jgi:hypothetical protein
VTLVGWTRAADQEDGGVPHDVAMVLARALTSVARVTFPASHTPPSDAQTWSSFEGGLIRPLDAAGVLEQLAARLRGGRSGGTLISTRQPEVLVSAFADGGFPWWLQGQVLLLSTPEGPPPDVTGAALWALFEDGWTVQTATLATSGVLGVVRPGVDGAVAGALSLSGEFDATFLAALERETRLAGLTWSPVREAEL